MLQPTNTGRVIFTFPQVFFIDQGTKCVQHVESDSLLT